MTVDGIKVIRLWTYLAANEGVLRRSLNYFSYMLMAILAVPVLPRSDVVVSTSPQFFCGIAGFFVSRLKGARWVLEIRDLWPDSIVAVGAIRNQSSIRVLRWLERWAYRKADRIVTLTHAFVRHVEACGIERNKITVITNGVDPNGFCGSAEAADLREELGLTDKFVAAYFGTLGMAHGLETILRAAELLRDEAGIVFLIAGRGAARNQILGLRAAWRLDNVVVLDQQPRERMPALWASCDASLVLLRESDLFTKVIPSKLFESMAASRPVVLGVRGESREILEAAGCGTPVEPEDPAGLADAVRRLAADRPLSREMGMRGRRWVAEHGDRRKLAATFLRLLDELA